MRDVSAVKLELKLLVETVFNVLDVRNIAERKVVYLVREIKFVTLKEQLLNGFWVMMATDVEVTWNFIDEDESTQLASLVIC